MIVNGLCPTYPMVKVSVGYVRVTINLYASEVEQFQTTPVVCYVIANTVVATT